MTSKATQFLVKGKPIIVDNFASVSGITIKLEQPDIGKPSIEPGFPKTHPTKGSAAFKQNQTHLNTCNTANVNLISKLHLPNALSSVIIPPVHKPDDEKFVLENWFLKAIKVVAETETPTPRPSPFQFSTAKASVAQSTQLLQDAGNNFANIIDGHQDTSLSYSSKFRLLDALASIYRNHDTFPFF